ncbi:MAG TPA: hypothetical protein PK971_12555, partial [Saprospiraceae bacterium]|nr:hypothetical protein [Saprospiraceae bacterium]
MKQTFTLALSLLLVHLAWGQVLDTTRLHAATRLAPSPHLPPPPAGQGRAGALGDAPDFAGRCNNLPSLGCGGFVSGNTAGANSFNANDYKLPFGGDYNGPDKAYKVTVATQTSARFVLKIENSVADLDLILLKQCGDLSSQVVLAGYSLELNTSTGYYLEVLDLNLTPGNYVLVVDGKWSDQVGNFKVTMNCACTCVEADYDLPAGMKLLCDNFGDYQTNKALSPQSSRWG